MESSRTRENPVIFMKKRYNECILATAVVPWTEDFTVDEESFRREIRFLAEKVTPHLYIFGTAGEGHAVSELQFLQITRLFCEECRAQEVEPMVGLISHSLAQIQERIRMCRDLGVRDYQLAFPSWGVLTEPEWEVFFDETCGRFPDCRFLHYNNSRAGVKLEASDYAKVAVRHSNLVAVKHTQDTPERMLEFLDAAPELQFFAGEKLYAQIRDEREAGLLLSLSLVHPQRAHRIFEARGAELQEAVRDLSGLHQAVVGHVQSCGAHIDSAYDKALYKVSDPEFPLRLLPPYRGCTEEAFRKMLEDIPQSWRQSGSRSGGGGAK